MKTGARHAAHHGAGEVASHLPPSAPKTAAHFSHIGRHWDGREGKWVWLTGKEPGSNSKPKQKPGPRGAWKDLK